MAASFLSNNGAMIGMGLGLLPYLYKNLFGNSNAATSQLVPDRVQNTAAQNAQVAGNLDPNYVLTPGGTFPSISGPGLNQSGAYPNPATGNPAAGLPGMTGMQQQQQQNPMAALMPPPPPPVPAIGSPSGGAGPNGAVLQGLNPAMTEVDKTTGAMLGPAALNPLMVLMRRLGGGV